MGQTDGQTDATKYIISLALRSIINMCVLKSTPPNIFFQGFSLMVMTIKMQLYIEVSPPANITNLRITLTHVTFDLDPSDL